VKYELVPGDDAKARFVELTDKIPADVSKLRIENPPSVRHPRARQKKPTWRR
jgi:hypothetical protein